MGRVQASWRMFRFSWNFVKSERVLFLYPVLVFLIQLVVIALMLSILGLITYNTVNNIGGVNKLVNTVTSFSNSSMGDPAQSVQASTMKLSDSLFTTENNILIIGMGSNKLRIVTHLDYTEAMHDKVQDILKSLY